MKKGVPPQPLFEIRKRMKRDTREMLELVGLTVVLFVPVMLVILATIMLCKVLFGWG